MLIWLRSVWCRDEYTSGRIQGVSCVSMNTVNILDKNWKKNQYLLLLLEQGAKGKWCLETILMLLDFLSIVMFDFLRICSCNQPKTINFDKTFVCTLFCTSTRVARLQEALLLNHAREPRWPPRPPALFFNTLKLKVWIHPCTWYA